jgi:hypothetical protein
MDIDLKYLFIFGGISALFIGALLIGYFITPGVLTYPLNAAVTFSSILLIALGTSFFTLGAFLDYTDLEEKSS